MEQIKIIRESLGQFKKDKLSESKIGIMNEKGYLVTYPYDIKICKGSALAVVDEMYKKVEQALTALAQLETGMQSVSERSVDIPIEQPTKYDMADDAMYLSEKSYKDMSEGELLKALGMDSGKWLNAFYDLMPEARHIDRETMRGWVANMIMAGYDHAKAIPIHIEDDRFKQPTVNELSQVKPSIEEIRNKAINEVADSYHGEMANYFCKKANNEKLAGVKEDYFALADKHREYQNDIKNQVWVSNNLKP